MKIKDIEVAFVKLFPPEDLVGKRNKTVYSDPQLAAKIPKGALDDAINDVLIGNFDSVYFEGFLWPTATRLYKSRTVILSLEGGALRLLSSAYIDTSIIQEIAMSTVEFRLDIAPSLKPSDSEDWLHADLMADELADQMGWVM